MKASELRDKSRNDLVEELSTAYKDLFRLKMQRGFGGSDGASVPPKEFKPARRKIARIKTILNEKAREEAHE